MKAYWIRFTDGSAGCCEGTSAADAAERAASIEKKTVRTTDAGSVDALPLPYPASPIIWQEPASEGHTPCPPFCWNPETCAGRSYCTRRRSCTD